MISDADNRRHYKGKSRAVGAKSAGEYWGDSQKLECVKTFLMTGNLTLTAAMLKIPLPTVKTWRKMEWWKEIEDDFRVQDELMLSSRLQKIMAKTLDVVEDRLENGDYVYDQKTGAMRRKPVNMRDAHKVFTDQSAQREEILNRQAPRASVEQVGDKLLKLAEKFAALAGAKQLESNTIEGEVVEIQDKMAQADGIPSEVEDGGWSGGSDENSEAASNNGSGVPWVDDAVGQ